MYHCHLPNNGQFFISGVNFTTLYRCHRQIGMPSLASLRDQKNIETPLRFTLSATASTHPTSYIGPQLKLSRFNDEIIW